MEINMRKCLVFIFYALFASVLIRASLYAEEVKKPDTAAAKLVETTNQRLNEQVKGLAQEADTLKSNKIILEGQVNTLLRQKDEALEQLKKITVESSSLKGQITALEANIADSDNKRKDAIDENVGLADQIKQLEDKYWAVIELEKEKDKYKLQVKRLENEFIGMQKQKVNLEGKIGDLRESLVSLQEEKSLYSKDNTDLRKQLRISVSQFIEAQKRLTEMNKDNANMHYNLGVIQQNAGNYDRAIAEYNRTLKINPKDADAHYNLALVYETIKNNRDKALFHYECYLALNPEASDNWTVKKRITDIKALKSVWGEPYAKGMWQKEKLGRFE